MRCQCLSIFQLDDIQYWILTVQLYVSDTWSTNNFLPFYQFSCFTLQNKTKISLWYRTVYSSPVDHVSGVHQLCLVFILDIFCTTPNLLLNNFSGINVCNNTSADTLRCCWVRGPGTAPSICLLGGAVWQDFRVSVLCVLPFFWLERQHSLCVPTGLSECLSCQVWLQDKESQRTHHTVQRNTT